MFGYTSGVSTADSILAMLSQLIHCPTVVVFIDLEKAFELVSPHVILDALATHSLAHMENWLWPQADSPASTYRALSR